MNNSTYRFTLDLQKHNSQMSIAVYKYDNAVTLYIGLTDGGKPYTIGDGCHVYFYGKRADGKPLIHKCKLNENNTEIIYSFKNSTAYVGGVVDCQIRIYDGENKLITAPKFTIVVEERVVDEDDIAIEDVDKLIGLEAIINDEKDRAAAEDLRNEAEIARNTAEDSREAAEKERKSVWVRYSAYYDGKNSSDTWVEGMDYIGVAQSHDEPTDKDQYTWILFKGARGDRGEQGEKGEPFRVVKQYKSFANMRDDFNNEEVPSGSFVMISTSNPAADDNGKLYCKGDTSWNYITDMTGAAGLKGEQGLPGKDGVSVTHTWDGTNLTVTSASGTTSANLKGDKGDPGASAYQIAQMVTHFDGTEAEWVASLQGTDGTPGKSAYQIAQTKGYKGSEDEWVASLQGKDGTPGKSAYQIAREMATDDIGSADEWIKSLQGKDGTDGAPGKSAYEIAKEEGHTAPTQADWVASLNGTNGKDGLSAYEIVNKVTNNLYKSEEEWLASLHGNNGINGLSAYEIANKVTNNLYKSEEEWLASLHGNNGLSAYEIAKGNGFKGSEGDWIASLRVTAEWKGTSLEITSAGDKTSQNLQGPPGKSAYEVAVINKFDGDEAAWLNSLKPTHEFKGTELYVTSGSGTSSANLKGDKGDPGASAYQIAQTKGYKGTEDEWVASLQGVSVTHEWDGTTLKVTSASGAKSADLKGDSAYDIARKYGTYANEQAWLNSLMPTHKWNGTVLEVTSGIGTSSAELGGKSAYEIANKDGKYATEEDWLKSLVSHKWNGTSLEITSGIGTSSKDLKGDSAYDIAKTNGYEGTEQEWLDSLHNDTKNILTTGGELLRVFVGTQEEYNNLDNTENMFAIITDDPTKPEFDAVIAAMVTKGLDYTLSDDGTHYICSGIGTAYGSGDSGAGFIPPTGSGDSGAGLIPPTVTPHCIDLIIPSTYEGLPVTKIADGAFRYAYIKSVTIPDSVTSIGDQAFQSCFYLKDASIGDGVTSIGAYAFNSCSRLNRVDIGDSVTSIGEHAFMQCNLKNIVIPNGCTTIGDSAFAVNRNITSIILPDSVTSIGEDAFSACTNLKTVNIPEGVSSLSKFLFSGCRSLETITIPKTVKSIDHRAFHECPKLHIIYIPKSVNSMGSNVFEGSPTEVWCEANEKPDRWDDAWSGAEDRTIYWGEPSKPDAYIASNARNATNAAYAAYATNALNATIATDATNATYATYDGAGNEIETTYEKISTKAVHLASPSYSTDDEMTYFAVSTGYSSRKVAGIAGVMSGTFVKSETEYIIREVPFSVMLYGDGAENSVTVPYNHDGINYLHFKVQVDGDEVKFTDMQFIEMEKEYVDTGIISKKVISDIKYIAYPIDGLPTMKQISFYLY